MGVTRLPLGADKQDQAPARSDLREILLRSEQAANRFADVDDVDQIAAGVNVRPHLGVPAARAVTEMDTRLDELFDESGRHERFSSQLAHRQLDEPAVSRPPTPLAEASGVRSWVRPRYNQSPPTRAVRFGVALQSNGCRKQRQSALTPRDKAFFPSRDATHRTANWHPARTLQRPGMNGAGRRRASDFLSLTSHH